MCNKTSISFATAHASQKQDKARKKDKTVQKEKRKRKAGIPKRIKRRRKKRD
jgi:hypothetical protein